MTDARLVSSSGFKSYSRIFRYAGRSDSILYAIAFASAITAGSALPLMNLIFGKFVTIFDEFAVGTVNRDEYKAQILRFTRYYLYLFVARFSFIYLHTTCVSAAGIRTAKSLRLESLRSVLRQDMQYFDTEQTRTAAVEVTANGNIITSGISEKLSVFVQSCATFVAAFVVAFTVEWKLTCITFTVVPAIIAITGFCLRIEVKSENVITELLSSASALLEEIFSSVSTVHAFWLQPVMAKRYEEFLVNIEREGLKKSPNYGLLLSSQFFCVYSAYGLAFWQGIRMYASGQVRDAGNIVTVIFAVVLAATALTQVASQIIAITKAAAAAQKLFLIIDKTSAIDPFSRNGIIPEICTGNITIRALDFAYPSRPGVKVLDGLDLHAPAGKCTALVGASGSGKSTIVALLERWYGQSRGALLLDSVDIREHKISWLRTQIRLVQQEPVLFSGTIFDNVAYGLFGTQHAEADHEQKLKLVRKACQDSFAHDFIQKLPKQYETQIGERARMLSGGQRQRIAIARSIISSPKVLLLDEATSALDPRAENIVQTALETVSSGRTTIVIAHRLSTVQKADHIAVLSGGRVVEQGSHHQLMVEEGAYAKLVRAEELESRGRNDNQVANYEEDDRLRGPDDQKFEGQTSVNPQGAEGHDDSDHASSGKESMHYSLARCLWILIKEQRNLWSLYATVAVACFLGGGTFPVQAVIFGHIFQTFQMRGAQAIKSGDFWALMFFVVALANLLIYFVMGWTVNKIIQKVSWRYRLELFRNTISQELAFFDLEHNAPGAIASRLWAKISDLNELLGVNFGMILVNVFTIICVSILGIAYGWKLGLVCVFAALPPMLLSGYFRIFLEFKLEDDTAIRFASSAAIATEAVAAIRTVASLTLENEMLRRYREKLDAIEKRAIRALLLTMFLYALTQSINSLAMALGLWYGGQLVARGEYSNEQFFVVFVAVIVGGESAAAFFQYTTSLTKATASANYIFWLRGRTPRVDNGFSDEEIKCSPKQESSTTTIDCRNVHFTYPSRPSTKVVRGINLVINPGESVAFVGPSGCGKSTLVSLFERFYDPTSGCIIIDNRPVVDLTPRDHRQRLALVQQEPSLFKGSIRENVKMGSIDLEEPSIERIEQACKDADIFDFACSLSEGLETEVGTRGIQLSGGQRQRVAIARALIRSPKILLLDEATSALDTNTEKTVQHAISATTMIRKGITIAVAHRLSTIRNFDVIAVIEAGRIVEVGSHVQLMEKKGMYSKMCEAQALDASLDKEI